jgi:twinkle protein
LVKLPKKDANECLQAGIGKEDIDACFKAAQYQDPLELKMADAFMEEAYLILHPELQKDVGIKLDLGRGEVIFRPDETTIWSGINGQGKSMVLGQVLLDTIKQGKKVCIASLEVKPSRTLARMLRQVCGCKSPERNLYLDAREWLYNKLWIFDFVGEVSHAKLLQIFEYAYKRYGVDIFLIDSLMMLDIREDKIEEQKKFAQKVCSFARKFGVHVHLVAHPRKQQSEENMPNKMDISGSGMITNAVENVLIVWRNKVKETILDKYNTGQITFGDEEYKKVEKARKSPDSCVICVKNKNGDWEGIIPLSFHRDSYQFLPSPSHELKKYIEPTESGKEWFEE